MDSLTIPIIMAAIFLGIPMSVVSGAFWVFVVWFLTTKPIHDRKEKP